MSNFKPIQPGVANGTSSSSQVGSIDKKCRKVDGFHEERGTIFSQCVTCKVLAKTPARSVVAMPRASTFNEVLKLDLKIREGKLILYMMDHFSRLTKGVFIKSKKPAEAVNAVMLHWVAGGFGRPASLHTDVGGEFTNAEVVKMAER